MVDYLTSILFTGAGIGIIIGLIKRFVPIEKLGDRVENFGNFISTTGGIRFGKAFWQGCENFIIEWVDYLFYRFKRGLRSDNPELLKKIDIVKRLKEKVALEEYKKNNAKESK